MTMTLEVTQTDPGEKGNTAQGASKPATLETGATINVPLFIKVSLKTKTPTPSPSFHDRNLSIIGWEGKKRITMPRFLNSNLKLSI